MERREHEPTHGRPATRPVAVRPNVQPSPRTELPRAPLSRPTALDFQRYIFSDPRPNRSRPLLSSGTLSVRLRDQGPQPEAVEEPLIGVHRRVRRGEELLTIEDRV